MLFSVFWLSYKHIFITQIYYDLTKTQTDKSKYKLDLSERVHPLDSMSLDGSPFAICEIHCHHWKSYFSSI